MFIRRFVVAAHVEGMNCGKGKNSWAKCGQKAYGVLFSGKA